MVEQSGSDVSRGTEQALCERRDFARSFDSLEAIYAFVETILRDRGVDAATTYAIVMTIEELFTNMVKYNSAGRGPLGVQVECSKHAITCHLSDPDSDHFDITKVADVDIHQAVEQRQPGGLGIHLIRRVVDSISYDYTERRSTVSFVKRLSNGSQGTD
ncbi:MAG: ATP-binding protein [Rhodanobacteraceae bacterium]